MQPIIVFFGGAALLFWYGRPMAAVLLIAIYFIVKSNIIAKWTDQLPYAHQIDLWFEGK